MKGQAYKKTSVFIRLHPFGFMFLLLCSGCGSPRGELFEPLETPLAWPEPPETPRIRYIGSLSTEADLKKEVPWSQGLSEIIFGKKQIGILVGPYAVAVDLSDRLFVTDVPAAVVHIFDLDTRDYKQFSDITKQEKLMNPVGLAVVNGQIYVVDSQLHKVCVFDRDGGFKFSFGREQLERPSGIAYWPTGERIYISDSARHIINIFSKEGKPVRQFGSRGVNPGMFNFPTHLWVDHLGQLYVSDTLNYRIQVFTSEGRLIRVFGQQGDRPGYFAHPCGIATDSFGHIYVTDRQFENIQVFDGNGRILMAFGQEGSGLGHFWLPAGIFIDNHNRVFVADSFNKRVQIFKFLGETQP